MHMKAQFKFYVSFVALSHFTHATSTIWSKASDIVSFALDFDAFFLLGLAISSENSDSRVVEMKWRGEV